MSGGPGDARFPVTVLSAFWGRKAANRIVKQRGLGLLRDRREARRLASVFTVTRDPTVTRP